MRCNCDQDIRRRLYRAAIARDIPDQQPCSFTSGAGGKPKILTPVIVFQRFLPTHLILSFYCALLLAMPLYARRLPLKVPPVGATNG